jgi:HD superfamily phosphohydrolase
VRDSYYTGARYGQIDVSWLISALIAHEVDEGVHLALDFRAIYAFDDYMIARHHMFLMVYFHHRSVAYEELLKRFVTSPDCDWSLPADLDAYLGVDDIALEAHLRTSANPWARRIVDRDPYRRVFEVHGTPAEVDLSEHAQKLVDQGIEVMRAGSTGEMSRYHAYGQKRRGAPPLYVIERMAQAPVNCVHTLEESSLIYRRYADARRIARLYVAPGDVEHARRILGISS